MNETQVLELVNVALSVITVAVNGIAPQIARRVLSRATAPRSNQTNWMRQTLEGPRRQMPQKWAYALMDFYGQVTITLVAVLTSWFQALVFAITCKAPVTWLAWTILVLDLAILTYLLGMRSHREDMDDYLPDEQPSAKTSLGGRLISVFGPPPPRGAWRNGRFLAIALVVLLGTAQLAAGLGLLGTIT